MIRLLKQQDLFGHPIELTFNNKGSTHKTLCGGVVSIVIKAVMAVYTYILFRKLWLELDDKLTTVI